MEESDDQCDYLINKKNFCLNIETKKLTKFEEYLIKKKNQLESNFEKKKRRKRLNRQLSENLLNFNEMNQSENDFLSTLNDSDLNDDEILRNPCKQCKWQDEETGRMIDACNIFFKVLK